MDKQLKDKWLEKMRGYLRLKHYSWETEKNYLSCMARYWDFVDRLPREWSSEKKAEAYLTMIARERYSPSTQNVHLNAILFFYNWVVEKPLVGVDALRARERKTIRMCPTREETLELLSRIKDSPGYPHQLIGRLLYAGGLRISEGLELRVKDIDFPNSQLAIYESKGGKSRFVPLPCSLIPEIKQQLRYARLMWERDHVTRLPVSLPGRIANKAKCNALNWSWYWLFPAHRPCNHPRTHERVKWHVHQKPVQKAVAASAVGTKWEGLFSPHVLRHAYATHVYQSGQSQQALQKVMGHKSIETTMQYVHAEQGRIVSPLELTMIHS